MFLGIISLFILSALAPLSLGGNVKTTPKESKVMDNLDYYFYNEHSSTKVSHYREYLKQDYSINVVESTEQPVVMEPLEQMLSYGPMDSAWPMQSYNNHHTGRSPYSNYDNPGIEKWRFYSSGGVDDTPVIDNNGIIYFCGAYEHLDYYLIAVYPNGTLKWRFKTDGLMSGSSPAIAEDGTLYVGSWDSKLYALNPNGTEKWKIGTGAPIASSPAIAEDGTIYVGTMDPGNSIVAVNPISNDTLVPITT